MRFSFRNTLVAIPGLAMMAAAGLAAAGHSDVV